MREGAVASVERTVELPDAVHKYVYMGVPPDTMTVADPEEPP